jgi:DNA-binding PadR family transcriptional regulator
MKESLGRLSPQSAPRGLLVYWMLHRISKSPTYGYEILTEIERKTDGAWRPGPGSVYPLLKRLVAQGYVAAELAKDSSADQRRYRITSKGVKHIEETRAAFRLAGRNWTSMRSIFVDLVDDEGLGRFLLDGSKNQFEIAKNLVESHRKQLPPNELELLLKEYAFGLERQLGWTNQLLKEFRPRPSAAKRRYW